MATFCADTASKINRLVDSAKSFWWDTVALRQAHTWAGHFGRMALYDKTRWAYRALKHRNYEYLCALQQEFGSQCHGRRFHVWRWERAFYSYYGPDWQSATLDPEGWSASFGNWLTWRTTKFNAKTTHRGRGTKKFKEQLVTGLREVLPSSSSSHASSSISGLLLPGVSQSAQ